MSIPQIISLKKSGNVALNSGNYSEAIKYYTDGLEKFWNIHPNNEKSLLNNIPLDESLLEARLYCKRSVALLKLDQYYFAFEDAKQVTEISPEWYKGYLRKADIQLQCGLYQNALKDYQMALRYLSSSELNETKQSQYLKFINSKISHVLFLMQRERAFDYQIPWIGAAFGLVVGMSLVTWDYVSHGTKSYINHPILKLAFIGVIAYVFFYLASFHRSYNHKYKLEMLKPPYRDSRSKND
ncbi:hypothetical protein RDWZM_007002 [Blomia tropicalis]|uniref:Tetratricopeptide repeat protein n=1 Tax=Blomia tropicalis TaxID=40697 RepID=A0A9Q0M8M2_BLOTA|nr:hypothetical protein RDWZM_007002 [Blomia tropicalis]